MNIADSLEKIKNAGDKALSVFITAGFPEVNNFVDLVVDIYDNGADIIELGMPFSDPLADGPVIQKASDKALQNGMNISKTLDIAAEIKRRVDKPLILMGYANPIQRLGKEKFIKDASAAGVDGLIIPDVPLEEYDSFFDDQFNDFEIINLTTPTSSEARISAIDKKSRGFVYCVSVTGTTGVRNKFDENVYKNLERTYSIIKRNKMLIGFGISKPSDIKSFRNVGDGFIIGSAVIRSIDKYGTNYAPTLDLVNSLSEACKNSGP
jgi:tryptophan synthase alpha chain